MPVLNFERLKNEEILARRRREGYLGQRKQECLSLPLSTMQTLKGVFSILPVIALFHPLNIFSWKTLINEFPKGL